nr:MAG TPA: hypothetical protein [Caudoviricetes sp.]
MITTLIDTKLIRNDAYSLICRKTYINMDCTFA